MQRYADIDRDSGVLGYDIFETSIIVYFKGATKPYSYSYRKAGISHVEKMKLLALNGNGLNKYINEYVRKAYD